MTVDLTKEERGAYDKCLGQCTTCSFNGACNLQKKIKDGESELRRLETVKEDLKKEGVMLEEFLKWWYEARGTLGCVSFVDKVKVKAGWKGALKFVQKLIADGYSTDEIKNLIRKELRGG